jgi:hypothetical protein
MCRGDDRQLCILGTNAAHDLLNTKELLPKCDDTHQAVPHPPTNYRRKDVNDAVLSLESYWKQSMVRSKEHRSSQDSFFRAAQRKYIKSQVYESEISQVEDGGYTAVDIALLELVLVPVSTEDS